jgi:hypothetical protein
MQTENFTCRVSIFLYEYLKIWLILDPQRMQTKYCTCVEVSSINSSYSAKY